MALPKKIHFVWFGPERVENVARVEHFKRLHPLWEVKVWVGKELYERYPFLAEMQVAGLDYAWQSDYARLYLLNEYGGFYSDIDTECFSPFDTARMLTGNGQVICCAKPDSEELEFHVLGAEAFAFTDLIEWLENRDYFLQAWEIIRIAKGFLPLFVSPVKWFNATAVEDAVYSWHHYNGEWRKTRKIDKVYRKLAVS